jgi:uncharacterized protein (DUF2141 family)
LAPCGRCSDFSVSIEARPWDCLKGDFIRMTQRARRRRYRANLVGALLLLGQVAPAAAADLYLTVDGIGSDKGEILIGLYDSPAGFDNAINHAATRGLTPDPLRLVGTAIRANRGAESTCFTHLSPGRYAVIAIHDENDDGRLDENIFGVPTEGYGFSNNARGFLSLGAPSFAAAAITVASADVRASVTLRYPAGPSAEGSSAPGPGAVPGSGGHGPTSGQ